MLSAQLGQLEADAAGCACDHRKWSNRVRHEASTRDVCKSIASGTRTARDGRMATSEIFGVERVPVVFVNAYLVDIDPLDPSRGWFLVDSGLPGIGAKLITRAAAAR